MSESSQEALPHVCEWSGDSPGCPGVVGMPFRMSKSGREASRVVGKPSRMSESGRETLPYVRVWSGGLTGGREANPDVRE